MIFSLWVLVEFSRWLMDNLNSYMHMVGKYMYAFVKTIALLFTLLLSYHQLIQLLFMASCWLHFSNSVLCLSSFFEFIDFHMESISLSRSLGHLFQKFKAVMRMLNKNGEKDSDSWYCLFRWVILDCSSSSFPLISSSTSSYRMPIQSSSRKTTKKWQDKLVVKKFNKSLKDTRAFKVWSLLF